MLRRQLLQAGALGGVFAAGAPAAAAADEPEQDWPNLARYADANRADFVLPNLQRRCVFLGDSITEMWARPEYGGDFLPSHGFIGRGISGQTTAQMLVRFYPDVAALRPATVHILAGINDIAGNTGPYLFERTRDNFIAMMLMARAAHIKIVVGSALPASAIPWRTEIGDPRPKVRELNEWLSSYCAQHHYPFIDYWSALADAQGALAAPYAGDAVHPNQAGFGVMQQLALTKIRH